MIFYFNAFQVPKALVVFNNDRHYLDSDRVGVAQYGTLYVTLENSTQSSMDTRDLRIPHMFGEIKTVTAASALSNCHVEHYKILLIGLFSNFERHRIKTGSLESQSVLNSSLYVRLFFRLNTIVLSTLSNRITLNLSAIFIV